MEFLKLSGWTNANALKNSVLSLISKNRLQMKKTDWKVELKDQPHLLIEVVDVLLDSSIQAKNNGSENSTNNPYSPYYPGYDPTGVDYYSD